MNQTVVQHMSERKWILTTEKNIAKDHEGKKIASRLANQSSKAGFTLLLVTF